MNFDLPFALQMHWFWALACVCTILLDYLDALRISMDVLATGRVDESDERWCWVIYPWLVVTSKFFQML